MIVAMMLPSSVPLVVTFGALVGRRRAAGPAGGACCCWATSWCGPGSGFAAWAADRGVHAAVDALPWLADHPQLIIGATLLVAGLWQFSPLRDRCLDECRSPLGLRHEPLARHCPSGARRSRWVSPTGRSASAAAGR